MPQELPFSTYPDLEDYLRTQSGLVLVVFVNRNDPLHRQVQGLRYLVTHHAGVLPMFVLPGGYCDLERVKYNIASYPTYLFLQGGTEVGRFVGRVTGRTLEDFLANLMVGERGLQARRVAEDHGLPLQ